MAKKETIMMNFDKTKDTSINTTEDSFNPPLAYEPPTQPTTPQPVKIKTGLEGIGESITDLFRLNWTIVSGLDKRSQLLKEQRNKTVDTKENITNAIMEVKDPQIQSALINSADEFNNVASVQKRIEWLTNYQQAGVRLQQKYGTAGTIALSVPFALTDPTTAPLMIASEGLYGAAKIGEMGTLAKTLYGGTTGAVVAGSDVAIRNQTIGLGTDDDVKHASLLGFGIGASGTFLVDKLLSRASVTTDSTNRILETSEAVTVKQSAIKANTDDISRIDEAIKVKADLEQVIQKTKKEVEAENIPNTEKHRLVLQKTQEKLDKSEADLLNIVNKGKEEVSLQAKAIKEASTNNTKLNKLVTASDKAIAKVETAMETIRVKYDSALNKIQTEMEELLAQKATTELKIKATDSIHPSAQTLIAQMAKNNETYIKQIAVIDKKIADLNKKVSSPNFIKGAKEGGIKYKELQNTLDGLKNDNIKLKEQLNINTQKSLEDASKLEESTKALKEASDMLSRVQKTKKDFQANWHKSQAPLTPKAKELNDSLSQITNVNQLLFTKGLLNEKEMKMLQGDYSLEGLRTHYVSALDKLNSELKGYEKILTEEYMNSVLASFEGKKFIDYLTISPIEAVKGSNNYKVKAIADLLHNGTINRKGKVQLVTAESIRKELDAYLNNEVKMGIRKDYLQAVKNKQFQGSFEDYSEYVGKEVYRVVSRMQREAMGSIPGGTSAKARAKIIEDNLRTATRKYSDDTETLVNSSVNRTLDYYEKMWEKGHKLDMVGFINTVNKGYATRLWQAEVFTKDPEKAHKAIYNAQIKYASAQNIELTPELLQSFNIKARDLINDVVRGEDLNKAVSEPFETLAGKKENDFTSLETGRVKSRKIELFEEDVLDFLESDALGSLSQYGLSLHGRFAMKEKLGVETLDDWNNLMRTIEASGKEVENLTIVANTILGRREVTRNPLSAVTKGVRLTSSISSVLHTLAFGVATVTEVTSHMKEFGFFNVIKHTLGNVKDVYKLYNEGTIVDKNFGRLSASYGEALVHHKASRIDSEGILGAGGRLQRGANYVTNKFGIYGGLAPLTDLWRYTSQTLTSEFIARQAGNISKITPTDLQRLNDIGLDIKDLERVRDVLKIDKNGLITNMDRSTWGDVDDMLLNANRNMMDRVVLHPSGATLPAIMTNYDLYGIAPKIFFKFMRFPVEAWERLALRGMQEMDIKQSIAILANGMMWYYILLAKDAMKEPKDRKYEADTDESNTQLFKDAMMMNSYLSGPMTALDYASEALTGRDVRGYEASLGAPFNDITRVVWDHKINLGLPFYTIKGDVKDVGDVLSNLTNMNDMFVDYSNTIDEDKGE